MRVAVAASILVIAPSLSEACSKMFPKKNASAAPEPPASVVTTTSATTPPTMAPPPIWQPPEPAAPPPQTPTSDDPKVKAAVEKKDHKQVKALLEKKAKLGKATDEEVRYLRDACIALKDFNCITMLATTYEHAGDDFGDDDDEPAPKPESTGKKKP